MQDIILVRIVIFVGLVIVVNMLKNDWFNPEKWKNTSNIKTQTNLNYDSNLHSNQLYIASRKKAEEFVEKLDSLGYFKYANQDDIDSLKAAFVEEVAIEGSWTSVYDEESNSYKDLRYYSCDGEDVYEQGGIIELLNDLKHVFDKMNFKCDITNHFEEWDEENSWLNHSITINGTEYIIFKHFTEGYAWGEAPFRIAQILNTELKKQNIDEQIYLINGANDGSLAVLSNAQYQLIYNTYEDVKWIPLEINEWAAVFKVNTKKFDYWNL